MSKSIWGNLAVPPSFILKVATIVVLFFCIYSFQTDFSNSSRSQKIAINAELLSHSILGYNFLVADSLWIRLLQDIDYKEPGTISKGWVFGMLDAITTLDRRYKIAYDVGAVILSILVRDIEGARIIYDRAVENFPYDWPLAYKASYHYLAEVKDCKRAAALFRQAVEQGAPAWVGALSSRLFAKSGQYEIARSVLEDTIEKNQGSEFEGDLKKRLAELDQLYQNSTDSTFFKGLDCK